MCGPAKYVHTRDYKYENKYENTVALNTWKSGNGTRVKGEII